MNVATQGAAEVLAAQHPVVMEGIKECQEAGLVVAVFSGQRGLLGAIACGVELQRPPRDFDLRTPHFWQVAEVLGAEVEDNLPVTVRTGDGLLMTFRAHRAVARLGGVEVEFMQPTEPVNVGGEQFESAFTEAHARHLTTYQTELGPLPVDDKGTLEIYTLRQGSGDKQDLASAALVLATTTPQVREAFLGAAAVPSRDRMTRFRREVALAAQQFMNEGVLLAAA